MTKSQLKREIIESLQTQGFSVNGHVVPLSMSKNYVRNIQAHSKKEQIILQKDFILDNIEKVRKYIKNGTEINPNEIELELRLIKEGSIEETLYRWWNLVWWSVPYQRAYGRQMRFMLWDKTHDIPFGLIGLQSPVLQMSVRDKYLNIPKDELDYVINQSMQAQRLGALPPYNRLIGGKMVAMSLTSNELRAYYKAKYRGAITLINERVIDPQLLFITTTSAFGKSSIYNRLKYKGEIVAQSLGYTKGSGTFHISEELYLEIRRFLERRNVDTQTTFGCGSSRKMKIITHAFTLLGLKNYQFHNIQREFFIFPIAKNLASVIKKGARPISHQRKLNEMVEYWKERWAVPRAERDVTWNDFDAKNFISSTKRNITRWSK